MGRQESCGKIKRTACNVDKTGSGRVVIWIVLPTRLATMNMSMPSFSIAVSQGLNPSTACHNEPAISVADVEASEGHSGPSHLPEHGTSVAM